MFFYSDYKLISKKRLKGVPMKKIISIVLVAIIIVSFSYYSTAKGPVEKKESVITDNNGKVIEPISGNNDNIGH